MRKKCNWRAAKTEEALHLAMSWSISNQRPKKFRKHNSQRVANHDWKRLRDLTKLRMQAAQRALRDRLGRLPGDE